MRLSAEFDKKRLKVPDRHKGAAWMRFPLNAPPARDWPNVLTFISLASRQPPHSSAA
jgi:hypothetical protein